MLGLLLGPFSFPFGVAAFVTIGFPSRLGVMSMSAWPTHPRTWHVGTQDLLIRNLVLSRIEAVIVKVLPRLCAELNVGDASHVIPAPGVWW